LLADQYDSEQEDKVEDEFAELDSDFANFDLNEIESAEESAEAGALDSEASADEDAEEQKDEGLIEYDLSGISLNSDETVESTAEKDRETEDEFSALEIDLEDEDETVSDSSDVDDLDLALDATLDGESEADSHADEVSLGEAKQAVGSDASVDSDVDSLDESFLDELDAELDKVAGEDDELGGEEMEESSLDDLELDVSDEDLALMEEFSDSADSANHQDDEAPALEEELNLDDTLAEGDVLGEAETSDPEAEVAGSEELESLGALDDVVEEEAPEVKDDDVELPVASDTVGENVRSDAVDIDESDLGDEDDFDFLAGTDEAATKLDLARAYIEMGDSDGARDILEEVALEGNEDQKGEAQDLLKNLS